VSTNALRLPPLAAVSISNSNSSFPLAFSYCPSESEEAFSFFFDSLQEIVFLKGAKFVKGVNTSLPKAMLSDQAAGLISAMLKYLPHAQLQHCDWHAVEAIKKRFRKEGHTSTQVNKTDEATGLAELSWNYIKNGTFEALDMKGSPGARPTGVSVATLRSPARRGRAMSHQRAPSLAPKTNPIPVSSLFFLPEQQPIHTN
jgi:hypothetical protein